MNRLSLFVFLFTGDQIMSSRIHQNLKLEFSISLVLGLVFLVSGIALLLWGVILVGILIGLVHWFVTEGFQSSIVGWLVPALCFLSGGVFVYFGRHLAAVYPGWLRRASWLLGNTQPRKMLLTFPQGREASGRIAELREAGKPESSPPSEIVELRSPQWKIKDLSANPGRCFQGIRTGRHRGDGSRATESSGAFENRTRWPRVSPGSSWLQPQESRPLPPLRENTNQPFRVLRTLIGKDSYRKSSSRMLWLIVRDTSKHAVLSIPRNPGHELWRNALSRRSIPLDEPQGQANTRSLFGLALNTARKE